MPFPDRFLPNEGVILDLNDIDLVKPGVDGGFAEILLQMFQNQFPDVGDGKQKDPPLSLS